MLDGVPAAVSPRFGGSTPRLPNLRHLRAVQLVGALGSVNQAASLMNLSQPAVTQAVARLESQIAPNLFERHPTGTYPTEAGRILLHRIDRFFEELSRGVSAVARPGQDGVEADVLFRAAQLDALAALMHAPSLARAVSTLDITRTAFQRHINALEARLGVVMVFRDGHRYALTHAGEELARATRLARREIELGQEEIRSVTGQLSGRLSVGALPLARTYLVPRTLIEMGGEKSDIQLRLVEGSYEALLNALRNADIDILVGTLREPAPVDDVVETPLFQDRLCVVGRAGHPLSNGPPPGLDEVLHYPWIAPRLESPARKEFDLIFSRTKRQPPQIYEVASHMSVRAILRESDSLALISRCQLRYEEADGQLVVLNDSLATRVRTIGYSMRNRGTPTRIQQKFLQALYRIVSEESHLRNSFGKAHSGA